MIPNIILGRYAVDEILPRIGNGKPKLWLHSDMGSFRLKVSVRRLECIKRNQTCSACGLTGNIFILHSQGEHLHLDLFYSVPNQRLVLMTADHIIPRSKDRRPYGKSFLIENLTTLCMICNQIKADTLPPIYHTILEEQKMIVKTRYPGKFASE